MDYSVVHGMRGMSTNTSTMSHILVQQEFMVWQKELLTKDLTDTASPRVDLPQVLNQLTKNDTLYGPMDGVQNRNVGQR